MSIDDRPSVDSIFENMTESMSEFDRDFCVRMYADDFPKYGRRLDALGYSGFDHVLDAGCGFGQWTISLAPMNTKVSACDVSAARVEFINAYAKACGLDNITCQAAEVNELPYDDNMFDAIFCYGVVFLTPWRKTLEELARVLKPGGKLYINANGIGWYLFLWKSEHNKMGDYDPRKVAADSFADTLQYNRDGTLNELAQIIIEPDELSDALEALGFEGLEVADEGMLKYNDDAPNPVPFFRGEYEGQTGVYEIVGHLK